MSDPDHEIRRALERLSEPTDGGRPLTLARLGARRRRRRIRHAVLTMVPLVVVGVVGGLMLSGSEDDTRVTAEGGQDGSSPPSADETVSVVRTQVVGGDGGTARVVMEFDGPLPGRDVRYVDDIASVDAGDEIVYTTQDASGVHVCDNVHWFPEPAEGTVDLLIPAAWFAEGEGSHTSPLETIDDPAKFVVCGPHNGFFQYAIWGPVSPDVADVDITIDPDGTRLTVQIGSGPEPTATAPPDIDPDDGEAAKAVVSAFLDDVRRDDLDAAAERWTAYPDLGPDAPPADKKAAIEALVADPAFSRILDGDTDSFVTASWGWSTAFPVVTVLAPRDGDDPPAAVAFLTGSSGEGAGAEGMSILRLPSMDAASEPDAAGSVAEPGQQIVIPGAPLEGGARAYTAGREVSVDVDLASLTMTITLPADIAGDVAITVSAATPELPSAHAFALTIGSP